MIIVLETLVKAYNKTKEKCDDDNKLARVYKNIMKTWNIELPQ